MSLRQIFPGGIVKPGFNPLAAQTTTTFVNLYGWGQNDAGQLGLGNRTKYSSPVQVGSLTTWSAVATSTEKTMALKTDGTLWVWGRNTGGQLGLGNRTAYSSPKQVGALTTWSKIGNANFSSFAIKTDGTLWAWGSAAPFGQLGLGNTTSYSSPKQVGALTNWSTIAVNDGNAVYLGTKTDGTLWAWGFNNQGALGLNTTSYAVSSPTQIGALTNWLQVSAGIYNCIAVKTDGTLWSWGVNGVGHLGLGNRTSYSSPKQVGALTSWSKCVTGIYSCMAIQTNGTLWTWGYNNVGQLGHGNTTDYSSPKQVGSLTNWLLMANGYGVNGAIKTDGTLWMMGKSNHGQLGLGNNTSYSSPKQVGSSTSWTALTIYEAVLGIG
jgi:alpha-tubulin suppressor-like RCC1 family protein